jgi:Predicted AAA-ATPase
MNSITFQHDLNRELLSIAQCHGIRIDPTLNYPTAILKDLVHNLYQRFGRVAILIDEYDSPILKTLHNEQLAKEIRDAIQQFFTVIKSLDDKIQFVFITGVSSFAKAGLFSGINNLQILTLDKQCADICGYTDAEIDRYFAEYIKEWAEKESVPYDDLRQQMKRWYNGYHFGKNVIAVYNPFSILNALRINEFENFWFQSGTPTFLVELLKKEGLALDLEKPEVTKDFLGIFDVGTIPVVALMFQAGYLTIVDYDASLELYRLDYPNEEVRVSFQKYLFEVFAGIDATISVRLFIELKRAFINQDIEKVILFKAVICTYSLSVA